MFCNVYRLDEVFFRIGIKAFGKNLAEAVEFTVFHVELVCNGSGIFDGFAGIEVFAGVFLHRFCHGESRPGRGYVDFRIFIGKFHGAVGSHGAGSYDLFCLVDDVFDVSIGLVGFNGCEFRVVAGIHAFISEVSGDFKNPFIAAHQEPFQIQFRCNAKVHGHVQGIEMGGEGFCIGAAIEGLEHRRFHFQEVMVGVPFADSRHHGSSLHEGVPDFRIHDEIQVSLAVALFLVCETVPFFRQRAQGLGKHGEMDDPYGQFTGMGGENGAFNAEDIADVHQLEEGPFIFRKFISLEIHLDIAGLVADDAESGLALSAADHHSAGNTDMGFFFFQLFCVSADICCMVIPVEFLAIGFYAQGADFIQLFTANKHLVIQLRPALLFLLVFIFCHSVTSFPVCRISLRSG